MTPPARLVRQHRHDRTNVLVTGGSAAQRAQVAMAFHRESPVRRGPLICLNISFDEMSLRMGLQARMSSIIPVELEDPIRASEHGTLFVDAIGGLSTDTQHLLLVFLSRYAGSGTADREGFWGGRLVTGHPDPLAAMVRSGRFLATLCDSLDKVRVELSGEKAVHVA